MGGVVGELWVNSFLLPDPYLSFKSYSDLSYKIDDLLSGEESVKNLNERDIAIDKTIQKIRPAIVKVYKYKKFAEDRPGSLLPGELLAQGALITNDGWLLTNSKFISNNTDYWVMTHDKKIYKSEQVIINDELGVTFVKISANNLPVVEFNLRHDLVDGQGVFLFGFNSGVMNSNIKSRHYTELNTFNDYIHVSEDFYKFIQLKETVDLEYLGSPVITLDGKMAGILQDQTGKVIPINHLTSLMKTTVQGQNWERPYLGVKFYDLTEVHNPNMEQTKGAQVLDVGIYYNSPAKGLLAGGDIILKVENEEINDNKNLSELIAEYKPEDTVKLTILRGEEETQVDVKLTKIK